MKYIEIIGKYFIFIYSMFVNGIKSKILFSRYIDECLEIGIKSAGLIILTSSFVGIVCCFQTNGSMMAFLPRSSVALSLKNMIVLELAATFTGIIFAGKNGALMANEISSMKISEQVDAINAMGLNSRTYLGLPKILASVTMFPLLVIISAFVSLYSGYLLAVYFLNIPGDEFVIGYKSLRGNTHLDYMLIKAVVFGFLISSISVFSGFNTEGQGETTVVKSSKYAFHYSCLIILAIDYFLTQLIL